MSFVDLQRRIERALDQIWSRSRDLCPQYILSIPANPLNGGNSGTVATGERSPVTTEQEFSVSDESRRGENQFRVPKSPSRLRNRSAWRDPRPPLYEVVPRARAQHRCNQGTFGCSPIVFGELNKRLWALPKCSWGAQ